MDKLEPPVNKELLLDVLGTLTKLRKDFPYTMLLYVLDPQTVTKFLDVFAGTTVTFPTQQELLECVTFAIVQKYGGFDNAPKEVLNGLTKKRYTELLRAANIDD
ncbi:MAG: hypothetical protein NC218_02340 [Acetobacter sp.]|nr:hypothetical protein [Acetobacter sp.]